MLHKKLLFIFMATSFLGIKSMQMTDASPQAPSPIVLSRLSLAALNLRWHVFLAQDRDLKELKDLSAVERYQVLLIRQVPKLNDVKQLPDSLIRELIAQPVVVEVLLNLIPDETLRTEFAYCFFYHAAAQGHNQTIELLLQLGVNINHLDPLGHAAVQIAARYGRLETVQLFRRRGAQAYAEINVAAYELHQMPFEQLQHILNQQPAQPQSAFRIPISRYPQGMTPSSVKQ